MLKTVTVVKHTDGKAITVSTVHGCSKISVDSGGGRGKGEGGKMLTNTQTPGPNAAGRS
eukprot:SAG31_NODE_26660_length_438_cov_1.073746_1_plen_58_part_10